METALERASQLISPGEILLLQKQFERIQQMPGAHGLFRRVASATDREQLADYLAEVRHALIFAGLHFEVQIEPLGRQGPDLKVSRDDHEAFVEVMRFRKVSSGPPPLDPSDEDLVLQVYGNPLRDLQKTFEKLVAKFRQVQDAQAIIAIWNDDGDLEELEVQAAVTSLWEDASRGILLLPSSILFILYGSPWIRAGDHKQLHCFALHITDQSRQLAWKHELEGSNVTGLIQRALSILNQSG
jgi:hypothetical protein